jgi:uncharacterized SAM-binding protein YcdF (DUF218 family)
VLAGGTVEGREFAGLHGARAYQAHLPAQHIDDLRQLVEGGGAQEATKGRHARVVLQLPRRVPFGARRRVAGQQRGIPHQIAADREW